MTKGVQWCRCHRNSLSRAFQGKFRHSRQTCFAAEGQALQT